MSTSPFQRHSNSSILFNGTATSSSSPSTNSPIQFYPHQLYSNAFRHHFLAPFLLQPFLPPKPSINSIRTESPPSSSSISNPHSSPTTPILPNKTNFINEQDQGKNDEVSLHDLFLH